MMQHDPHSDVVVIGGGPAGSTAAALLARSGQRVVVFEKKRFPRKKTCGGCLSGLAVKQVRQILGPDADLPGCATQRITFVVGAYRIPCNPSGQTRIASRAELDARLATAAKQAGAEICFGTPAHLARGDSQWTVRAGGKLLRPRWILLATGLARPPAGLDVSPASSKTPLLGQQWTQPANSSLPPPGRSEMHWLRGGYVGLATLPSARTIVALAAETAALDGTTPFERLQRLNPGAAVFERLPADASHCYECTGAAGFPWRPQQVAIDNVLLVGDAAGFEEPFSGEGIGQAMRSARLAAEAILAGQSVTRRYTAAMAVHRRTMQRTRTLGRILRAAWLRRLTECRPVLPRPMLAAVIRRMHVEGAT